MRGLGDRYADHVDRVDDKHKHRLRVAVYLQPKSRFERVFQRVLSTLLVVTGLVGNVVRWRWWSVLLAAELAVGAGAWLFSRRRWAAAEKALTERGDTGDTAPGSATSSLSG